MAGTTISNTVTATVILGAANYGNILTVTATGAILPDGSGAAGIDLPATVAGAAIVNKGTIAGGPSGTLAAGGIGVDLLAAANFSNAGSVQGGEGIASGVPANGPNGGYGVALLKGGTLANVGHIAGGYGGRGKAGGHGGKGVYLDGAATLTNAGTISGGAGGYGTSGNAGAASGGAGVYIHAAALLANKGTIAGGAGGASRSDGGGGAAGISAYRGSVTNSGHIVGGAGGNSTAGGNGGAGGIGVDLTLATLTNTGTVSGGAGGSGVHGGAGGDALVMFTGTLVATGTFIGGTGGAGTTGNGAQGAAIDLLESGTVIVEPQAFFSGRLVANPETAGMLQLAGTAAATLNADVSGFNSIYETAGANWVLAQSDDFNAGYLEVGGNLRITGTVSGIQIATLADTGALSVSGNGAIQLHEEMFVYGGTLTDAAGARVVIGGNLAAAAAGRISVQENAALYGFGTVGGAPVIDNGRIVGRGGTLLLKTSVTGSGNLTIDAGATVTAAGSLDLGKVAFSSAGAGELELGTPRSDVFVLAGFAVGDVVDLLGLAADGLSYANGTLKLTEAGTTVDTLALSGSFTASDFALTPDGSHGTDLSLASGGAAQLPATLREMPDAAGLHAWLLMHVAR